MKTCVITGAASGIGAALAGVFVAKGYRVIGVDRRADETKGFTVLECDLGDQQALAALVQKLDSRIDVLIHSAGINLVGRFFSSDITKAKAVLDVNLRAPVQLTHLVLQKDLMHKESAVIFISSLSHYVSYPGAAVYAASKDGLSAYARSLSAELKPLGIHVMTVFPGPTRTPHAAEHSPDNSREEARMPPEVLAQLIYTSLKRKRYKLLPGLSNKVFALIGQQFPLITERVMIRSILDKLPRNELWD